MNSGTDRARRYLQTAAGVTVDGQIGPITLAAVQRVGATEIVQRISDRRNAFYRSLQTFPTFGKGWMRRLHEVTGQALGWAR
ncbi:MAG: hypothetical protein EON87_16110 [Brevundimonas sp.]|nr:MAG: hypothetical protein EON87_16110 [Brevundimonas sp.]